ncbi:Coiled-coil domain-containing protein [Fasciola gigantica]|uniref:Coiled-coil domain-containing protein n=1 Tax=Fasciola gigantica TaxID=46835 RepID=A0A504Y9M2_FASGI|nr:Coiled-coil domain-containing protein [Fasciola gigantica]
MDECKGGKAYGLSFPTRKVKDKQKYTIQSVFNETSDEEESLPKLKPLPTSKTNETYHAKIHQKTKSDFEKAFEEDPSVFQYDEIYENICSEKCRAFSSSESAPKKQAKYVGRLLKAANERKIERELCAERKAQKEIEAEQDQYGDKESFVTSAYKEKLSELRELVEKREEEHQREQMMDVTRQSGLGGFYRYMYDHGMDERNLDLLKPNSPLVEESKQITSQQSHEDVKAKADDRRVREEGRKDLHHIPQRSHGSGALVRTPSLHSKDDSEVFDERPILRSETNHNIKKTKKSSSERSPRCSSSGESPKNLPSGNAVDKNNSNVPQPKPSSSVKPPNRDPNFIYARPRVTTDEEIEAARQRYLSRKAAGIIPVTVDSDSD